MGRRCAQTTSGARADVTCLWTRQKVLRNKLCAREQLLCSPAKLVQGVQQQQQGTDNFRVPAEMRQRNAQVVVEGKPRQTLRFRSRRSRNPWSVQAREWGRSMSVAEAEQRCQGTIGGRWCFDYHLQTPIPAKVRALPHTDDALMHPHVHMRAHARKFRHTPRTHADTHARAGEGC